VETEGGRVKPRTSLESAGKRKGKEKEGEEMRERRKSRDLSSNVNLGLKKKTGRKTHYIQGGENYCVESSRQN